MTITYLTERIRKKIATALVEICVFTVSNERIINKNVEIIQCRKNYMIIFLYVITSQKQMSITNLKEHVHISENSTSHFS